MQYLLYLLIFLTAPALTAQDRAFLLDFGPNDTTNGNATTSPDMNGKVWVSPSNPATSAGAVGLTDEEGTASAIELTIVSAFFTNGINHGGLLEPSTDLLGEFAIATATQDYFFTNASAEMKFSGLDPAKGYRFTLFASRNNTQVRTSGYAFSGANEVNGTLQSSGPDLGGGGYNGNNSSVFESEAVFPTAAGEINLTLSRAAGQFAYINLMKIVELDENGGTPVSDIAVSGDDITEQGETRQMMVEVTPADATIRTVRWSVDDPTIAEITSAGLLLPLKNGTVTVTASSLEPGSDVAGSKTVIISGQTISHYFIDFGDDEATTPSPDPNGNTWNNATDATEEATPIELRTSTDVASELEVGIAKGTETGGLNEGGLPSPNPALLGELAIPRATEDFFQTGNSGEVIFRNLDPQAAYQIRVFGSGTHTGPRETTYTLEGFNGSEGAVQTSGPDLDSIGYGGNTRTIFRSELVFPSDSGTITLTYRVSLGRFGYLNALRLSEYPGVELCPTQDERGIVFMGSSVARGQGAPNDMGYAFQYGQLLEDRTTSGAGLDWAVTNISVGGNNTTAVTNRWARDLAPLCEGYVVYGLSLANEGIRNRGQVAFDEFRDNMLALIERARSRGIAPVVVGNYSRRDFNATDYAFIKEMNLLIHEWDVPSINVLGTNDNGSGNWVTGFDADLGHPNLAGHEEFFRAFVPSMFDALAAGKVQPTRSTDNLNGVSVGASLDPMPITFTPEDTAHSYTFVVDIKTSGTGRVASWLNGNDTISLSINALGNLVYSSSFGDLTTSISANDNAWHSVAITHYFARGTTQLYLDGVNTNGSLNERVVPTDFALAGASAPETMNLRDLFFYRSGMNADEMAALQGGAMLKSSLEIYAPLVDGFPVGIALENFAQSTNALSNSRLTDTENPGALATNALRIYPNPVDQEMTVEAQDGRQIGELNLYDLRGRLMTDFGSYEGPLKMEALSSGLYLLRVVRPGGKVQVFKVTKL